MIVDESCVPLCVAHVQFQHSLLDHSFMPLAIVGRLDAICHVVAKMLMDARQALILLTRELMKASHFEAERSLRLRKPSLQPELMMDPPSCWCVLLLPFQHAGCGG